jgi:hypothetical protein
VTTLILLVVSVLLAGIVTYYATNITMTRTEQEDVDISKAHVWVNGSTQVCAFMVQNLGGRDVLIDKITVRGVESSWSDVWYARPSSAPTGDLSVIAESKITGTPTIGGESYAAATTDLPVASSGVALFYIKNPDNIDLDDIGTTVSITIFTVNGQYIEEVNVESASGS